MAICFSSVTYECFCYARFENRNACIAVTCRRQRRERGLGEPKALVLALALALAIISLGQLEWSGTASLALTLTSSNSAQLTIYDTSLCCQIKTSIPYQSSAKAIPATAFFTALELWRSHYKQYLYGTRPTLSLMLSSQANVYKKMSAFKHQLLMAPQTKQF